MTIGRKTKLAKRVVDKLKKSKRPIDDVPSCTDIYKVPNEPIVVKPLNNIADGAATNCTTRRAIINPVNPIPKTVVPYTPANAVTVLLPSMNKK